MRLARVLAIVALVLAPSITLAQSFTGNDHRHDQGHERRGHSARHRHHHQSADRPAGIGHRRTSRAATRRCRCRPASIASRRSAGLPPRRAHRTSPCRSTSTVVIDFSPGGRRADRSRRGPARRHAARDDQRHGRQGRGQPPHPRAAAEHAQRLLADLPDAGRRRHDRQQLQLDELLGERRAADDDGHRHRRRDGVVPDGQRLHRHLGVPVGRRHPGIQGAGRELSGRVRAQPRQRAQRRLQVGHQRSSTAAPTSSSATRPSTRTTTSPSARARRSATSSAASSAASPAGRSVAAGRSSWPPTKACASSAQSRDDDHRADAGAAPGRLLADLRAERSADSHLRSVHHPRRIRRARLHPRSVRRQRHSGQSHGSGGAQGAQVLSAAEPAGQSGDRRAELLRDRHRRAERRQHRRARRSPDLRTRQKRVRPLFVPQDVQRAGDLLPRGHRHRRGPRQRAEPGAQRRHRLQPDDLEHDA